MHILTLNGKLKIKKVKSFPNLKNKNFGLQLLKMLLCFWIVSIHTAGTSKPLLKKLFYDRHYHVPGFLIISFYFLYNNLSYRNINKIKERFVRLLIPYIIIPSVVWIINNILFLIWNFNLFGRKLKFKELINQFLIGHIFYGIFWFQFDIIILTLFFSIIAFIFKNHFLIVILFFGFVAYLFQYSGYNKKLFKKYVSLGNIAEIGPNAIIGLLFGSINLINIFRNYRLRTIFICSLFLYLLFKYDIFIKIDGFFYPGILYTIGALFLFIIFSLIPFENSKNRIILKILYMFSNYTGGIYYYHPLFRDIFKLNINIVKRGKIQGTILIYFVSYFFCLIGSNLFGKTKLNNLFN